MADVAVEAVRRALVAMLDEVMAAGQGYVLDEGTGMVETLASITAEEASRPVSGQSANLAAQVNHVRFYLDALLDQAQGADWAGSWRVGAVSDAEWRELTERLRSSTARARAFMETFEGWDERYVGGAIAIVAHTAYHLGEIRQGIGVLRSPIA